MAAELAGLAPGRALDLAAGGGRNSVWLARQGGPAGRPGAAAALAPGGTVHDG